MAMRMSPWEKIQHYHSRTSALENKRGWVLGKYTFSEYFFCLAIALWLAFGLPQALNSATLYTAALGFTLIYVVYWLVLFLMSGGLGRVVDVI